MRRARIAPILVLGLLLAVAGSGQAAPPRGFDWNQVLMMAIVGAIIGGLIGLAQKLRNRSGKGDGS